MKAIARSSAACALFSPVLRFDAVRPKSASLVTEAKARWKSRAVALSLSSCTPMPRAQTRSAQKYWSVLSGTTTSGHAEASASPTELPPPCETKSLTLGKMDGWMDG